MCRVQLGVIVGDPVKKPPARELAEVILAGALAEHSVHIRLDVRGQREDALVLCDRDGAQLGRPLVGFAEDPAVNALKWARSDRPGSRVSSSWADQDRRLLGLDHRELGRVANAETVPQHFSTFVSHAGGSRSGQHRPRAHAASLGKD
jgi:hypothetical protein